MFDPDSSKNRGRCRSLLDYTDDRTKPSAEPLGESAEALQQDARFTEYDPATTGDRRATRIEAFNRMRAETAPAANGDDPDTGPTRAQAADDANETYAHRRENAFDDAVAEPQPAPRNTTSGALIDPVVMISTAWRYRLFVVFTSILGAALGVMMALSTPHKYESVSQFVLDPRELRLTDTDFLPQSYSADAILALVDSQVQIVDSSPVLQAVVADLKLDEDPEFNGTVGGGIGIGTVTGFIRGLFSSQGGGESNRTFMAVQSLARAVNVFRGDKTFIVYVDVATEDPAKSALIANRIVNVYIANQRKSQSALFERTTAALTRQLDELRHDVEIAERRVEQYKADNDLVNAGGSLISDEQIIRLNQQLAQLRAQKAEIQVKAESASKLDIDSLLSGTSPEILQSSTVSELRGAYASAKRVSDARSTSLGPRHPQRIAAEQALKTARSEISNELRRIVEASQTELRRIIQSEQKLAADLAILKSKQVATSGDLVRLRELERDANATSEIYESFLKRARETREQQNLNTSNIRIISEATPALRPIGPSRKIIAIAGMFAGFFIGLAVALLLGAYRSISTSFSNAVNSRPGPVEMTAPEFDDLSKANDEGASVKAWLQGDNVVSEIIPLEPANDDGLADEIPVLDDTARYPHADLEEELGWVDDAAPETAPEYQDFDEEAESIRTDIRQMREAVARLKQARERAGAGGSHGTR
ncbi:MAG: GumC family protein [Hyphomicrobiales bacterium]|nr:GumC family protein [Hyphomicrobiales bacterium]